MVVNAYKTQHCGDYEDTYSIEIEYNVENEAECREASMKLYPYMPMMVPPPQAKEAKKQEEANVDFGVRLVRELFDTIGSRKDEDNDNDGIRASRTTA